MKELIIKRNNEIFCVCKGEETFYSDETLKDMFEHGYEIFINGKEIQYE